MTSHFRHTHTHTSEGIEKSLGLGRASLTTWIGCQQGEVHHSPLFAALS